MIQPRRWLRLTSDFSPKCLNPFPPFPCTWSLLPRIVKRSLRTPALREALHSYLAEISNRLDCPTLAIGGVEDHVHLLARFGCSITQADWVKELKRVSNAWVKQQPSTDPRFAWQAGYGVFSVSTSRIEATPRYIATQEQKHRRLSFRDEFRVLLRKHRLEWDEAYVWD